VWVDPEGDIPDEEISDSYDALTHMDLPGNSLQKVMVNLLCLEWGGESITTPPPHVYGFVLDLLDDGFIEGKYVKVDF
jgi:hypothetical protein